MDALNQLADTLLTRLAWSSTQAALLVGFVYLVSRCWPQLSAAMRCTLWWLVGAQLLLGLLWHAPLELPLLSSTPSAVAVAAPAADFSATAGGGSGTLVSATSAATVTLPWRTGIVLLWLLILAWQALLAVRQWRHARRVLRESQPLCDAALQTTCAQQARQSGLRRCPRLRVSAAIASPQVIGCWRPTVLMPAGHVLNADEAAMAFAHELAHVRRGDLWLAWVPALAQWLFCFHPLVRWAMREYALNRESACDAQVLRRDHAAPQDYGRLLLRLGVAPPMHAGLAGASPSFHDLKRRLTMLQYTVNQTSHAHGWLAVALIALVGVLPYRVVAADAANSAATPVSAPAAQASSAPPAPAAPRAPATPPHTAPAAPPAPPTPPAPPALPPPPPASPQEASGQRVHNNITMHTRANQGFALIDGDSVIVNGSEADIAVARRLQRDGKPIVWFRRGDKAYVIDDAAYVKQAKAAYAPLDALARQQGELGSKQGALGGKQGALGAQQGQLGARQGQLAAQRAMLASQRAVLATQAAGRGHAEQTQADRERSEASERALDQQQDELGRQQDALGRQQDELSRQQEALGAQQEALGRRQEEASRQADQQINKLLDAAIAKGVAKPAQAR